MATNDVNKRPRYFAGQYLLEDDFEMEQNYHIDRQQRHNRLLHIAGIAEGLNVTQDQNGSLSFKVSPGTAVDKQGRQIVLLDERNVVLQSLKDGVHTLFIEYAEKPDPQSLQENTPEGYRRILEEPIIGLTSSDNSIALASLTVTNSQIIKVDESIRQYSGLRLPGAENSEVTLRYVGDKNSRLARLNGNLEVKGTTKDSTSVALNVTNLESNSLLYVRNDGNVGVGTNNPQGFQIVLPENSKNTSSPKAGVTIAGGKEGNASIELRNNNQGTPYIDFARNEALDYHARIILTDEKTLAVQGSKLSIEKDFSVAGSVTAGSLSVGNGTITAGSGTFGSNLSISGNISASNISVSGKISGEGTTPVGSVIAYAGSTAPQGWLLCNGAAVSRETYKDLFAVIQTVYGKGDDRTTFNLPDLRGRTIVASGTGTALSERILGQRIGAENHQLTTDEMPSHNHTANITASGNHSHTGTTGIANPKYYRTVGDNGLIQQFPVVVDLEPTKTATATAANHQRGWRGGNYAEATNADFSNADHTHNFSTNSSGFHNHDVNISSTGRSNAHNNMQPSLVLNYIIKY